MSEPSIDDILTRSGIDKLFAPLPPELGKTLYPKRARKGKKTHRDRFIAQIEKQIEYAKAEQLPTKGGRGRAVEWYELIDGHYITKIFFGTKMLKEQSYVGTSFPELIKAYKALIECAKNGEFDAILESVIKTTALNRDSNRWPKKYTHQYYIDYITRLLALVEQVAKSHCSDSIKDSALRLRKELDGAIMDEVAFAQWRQSTYKSHSLFRKGVATTISFYEKALV